MVQFSQGFVHVHGCILIFSNHGIMRWCVPHAHTAIPGWCSNQEGKNPTDSNFYSSVSVSHRCEVTGRRQLVVLIRSEACDCSDLFLAALPHLIQVSAAAVGACVCAH